jgi:hypothetical protein
MDAPLAHQRAVEKHSKYIGSFPALPDTPSVSTVVDGASSASNSLVPQAGAPDAAVAAAPAWRHTASATTVSGALRAHLHALAAAELDLPFARPGCSLLALVDTTCRALPLRADMRTGLTLDGDARQRLRGALHRHAAHVANGAAFSEQGLDQALADMPACLDTALDAWRTLYRHAAAQREQAAQRLASGLLRPGSTALRQAQARRDEAQRYLAQLANEDGDTSSGFDGRRYLADEGFLPGPQQGLHPLRVFLSSPHADGQCLIALPRAHALAILGPLAPFRHGGRLYRVTGVVAPDIEAALTSVRLSRRSGCLLTGLHRQDERCPLTGAGLVADGATEHLHDLLEMAVLRAEELQPEALGEPGRFDVATYLGMGEHDAAGVTSALQAGGQTLLTLRFVPAARVLQVNRSALGAQDEGFPMGLHSGDWLEAEGGEGGPRERQRRVRPCLSYRVDALHLQPAPTQRLGSEAAQALRQSLHGAVEQTLRLQPGALASAVVGEDHSFLLCAVDLGGGDGLSRLATTATAFGEVAIQAQRLYGGGDAAVVELLKRLTGCSLKPLAQDAHETYEIHHQRLLRELGPEPGAAGRFMAFLASQGLRLPDAARRRVDGTYLRPDFFFAPHVWVFCDDGPSGAVAAREDTAAREALWARGDEVWVWQAGEDLPARIAQRPDIFGALR